MKIRIQELKNFGGTHISTGTGFAAPGDVVEVPDDEGTSLVSAGMAAEVEDEPPVEDEPEEQTVPEVVEEPTEQAELPAPKRERRTAARRTGGA